ncbi:hypothetical protein CEXT_558611 [Caerostris extrusa]|uniref:Uncharacterized protein n=1 Tax=Caerostris extrusa TaxID=172846 RepID=A0AAV4YA02_CAEEX|nr:hypothetical protein CEXT_558611 [Caerostris extrusa]
MEQDKLVGWKAIPMLSRKRTLGEYELQIDSKSSTNSWWQNVNEAYHILLTVPLAKLNLPYIFCYTGSLNQTARY